MKRTVCLLLVTVLLLGLAACGAPEPSAAEETAEPTPTPPPTGIALWEYNTLKRYNMEYKDFAEYWSLTCDLYFGDAPEKLLNVLRFPEKDEELQAKREEFNGQYGDDWSFSVLSETETGLDEKYCRDFEKELNELYEKSRIFLDECESWSDAQWELFANAMGVAVEDAKTFAEAYGEISEACRDKTVSRAVTLEVKFGFSEGGTRTETHDIYEIDGFWISSQVIDSAAMLINLVHK